MNLQDVGLHVYLPGARTRHVPRVHVANSPDQRLQVGDVVALDRDLRHFWTQTSGKIRKQ